MGSLHTAARPLVPAGALSIPIQFPLVLPLPCSNAEGCSTPSSAGDRHNPRMTGLRCKLRPVADIEIGVALLPEVLRLGNQPGDTLLQRLDGVGKGLTLRFSQQQVDVQSPPAIAREGHKMSLPGSLRALQSPKHADSLVSTTTPLKPKPGLSGAPASYRGHRHVEQRIGDAGQVVLGVIAVLGHGAGRIRH